MEIAQPQLSLLINTECNQTIFVFFLPKRETCTLSLSSAPIIEIDETEWREGIKAHSQIVPRKHVRTLAKTGKGAPNF